MVPVRLWHGCARVETSYHFYQTLLFHKLFTIYLCIGNKIIDSQKQGMKTHRSDNLLLADNVFVTAANLSVYNLMHSG